ncbi:MAG: hypothetical protein ACXVCY_12690 [Pseudobdellovibrionaceae bacterium]
MSTYVELEIQNLLNEEQDLALVCDRLTENLESSADLLTLDNVNSLARFIINSKQPLKLIHFVLRHIDNENFPIPWPYFLEALGHFSSELDEKCLQALTEGIQEDGAETEAARSSKLNKFIPSLGEWRSNRNYKIHKDYLNNKHVLLEQLVTLRTQQLYEQEKSLLSRLQKLYPGDEDIRNEINEHKQRYALEILQRRSPKAKSLKLEDLAPVNLEVEKARSALMLSLHDHVKENPEMTFDFSIIAFILECYEDALTLLSFCEETTSTLWFRLEILLMCRRFVEVLSEISKVELQLAHDPETFFATAYLRAQAMWGLGQKHTAIQILEGLVASRPQYRAAAALLSIWSGS